MRSKALGGLSTSNPFHLIHIPYPHEGVENLVEVIQPVDLDFKQVDSPLSVFGSDVGANDIGLAVGDGARDSGQHAFSIMTEDTNLDGTGAGLTLIPSDLDTAFRILFENIGTVGGMDSNPPATGDETNRVISRKGIAALGEPKKNIVQPLYAAAGGDSGGAGETARAA